MKKLQGKELMNLCGVYGKATSEILVREQRILYHNIITGIGNKQHLQQAFDLITHELQARKIRGIF